ncbi:transcriptional regulator [uncultured Lutibacter sp.]|uniref:transcriptional regulator n=1 Tax=uncultured Lutibacter sp. TaxID=437739 RepID=UPI00261867EF|nr:transcriptional regulator [uncultured Lutibacter sp.]
MTSVITGDIINSRNIKPQYWMPILKSVLNNYGLEPLQWEIYRGDSFQLEVPPKKALLAAIYIKACIRSIEGLDVRLAIGIGEKSYISEKITASNGSVFINSGECFENLRKSILAIKSPFPDFDIQMNLAFDLAQLTINRWTQKSAEIVKVSIENPNSTQKQMANMLHKTQSSVSKSLKIAGFDEIMKMERYYRNQITKLC